MDRRGFLRFLAAIPVAVVAAKCALPQAGGFGPVTGVGELRGSIYNYSGFSGCFGLDAQVCSECGSPYDLVTMGDHGHGRGPWGPAPNGQWYPTTSPCPSTFGPAPDQRDRFQPKPWTLTLHHPKYDARSSVLEISRRQNA